jgi:hypothetical protein
MELTTNKATLFNLKRRGLSSRWLLNHTEVRSRSNTPDPNSGYAQLNRKKRRKRKVLPEWEKLCPWTDTNVDNDLF